MLNDDKTEFLLLRTKQQLAKADINSTTVGESVVNTKRVVRNLGSWFDSQISMSTHIRNLCSSAFFHLHNISSIRKFLTAKWKLSPWCMHSLLLALTTAIAILYGLPALQLLSLLKQGSACFKHCSKACSLRSAPQPFYTTDV